MGFTRIENGKDGQIFLAKMDEPLSIRRSRKFTGTPSSVTVSKDAAGRYFISILVEEEIAPLPVVNRMAGMDLGLKSAAILSDGEIIPNPTYLRKTDRKLAHAQRRLAKKQKGSKNRAKARLKVAKIHAKIASSRNDWTHKLTTRLIHKNQVLTAESLQVKNLIRNPHLAKSIADQGFAELRRQIEYKAAWYGKVILLADRWAPTSKTCSNCGKPHDMPLSRRVMSCDCGLTLDRDVNAAINILSFCTLGNRGQNRPERF